MTKAQADEISKAYPRINAEVANLMQAGATPDDHRVQQLIAGHYSIVCNFWTPNAEQYSGLGQMYVDDPRFRADYDVHDKHLVEFFRDAIDHYAVNNLT